MLSPKNNPVRYGGKSKESLTLEPKGATASKNKNVDVSEQHTHTLYVSLVFTLASKGFRSS